MLKIKRVYDLPEKGDGYRVLVDRLWPRAMSKDRAHLDLWLKEIGPSNDLRKWFAHDSTKWSGFIAKYRKELTEKKDLVRQIKALEKEHDCVTLLYSAHDPLHNQALALRQILKGTRSK